MQSGQVNASQLLASFLGSENEKIGQSIVQQDFAGELKKLMPAKANGAGSSARNAAAKPGKVEAADHRLKTSAGQTLAGAETKSGASPSIRERKGAADSTTKINAITSKAQKEQRLAVTNPAIAATVLADLQYPAQTRKACEGMQNKEGQISIKDLKSLLDTQPAIGSEIRAQVPAEHARALVESIIAKGDGTNQKESASGGTLQSSVQIKTEGSYTPEEFRGLLEKVLQQADTTTARTQLAEPAPQPGSVKTAKTEEGPKKGQTESLVETVLPSFISPDHENDSTRKIFASNSNDQTSEAQSAKVRDVRENSIENVSDNLKSEEQSAAAKVVSGGEDNEGVALVTGAGIKGDGTGSSTLPASGLSSASQETAGIPVEDLEPVLKYFDARIMSAGPQQPEVNTSPTPAPGGPYEALAAQAQNLAPPVKGAEKQADGPRGTLSSLRLPQDTAEQTEAARIITVAAEFPSSERSFDGNPNQEAVPSPEIQAKTPAPAASHEKIPAESGETLPGVENGVKAASANQILGDAGKKAVPATESTAGKLSASIEAGAEAIAAKSDTEQIPEGLQETLQGVENDVKAASANQILGDAGEKAVPAAKSTAEKLSASIEAGAEAIAAKSDTEPIPAGLQETSQGVENDVKAASANQILGDAGEKAVPAAQSTAGKLSASIEAGAEAIAAKSDTEPIPAEFTETLQAVENDVKAASANQILGDAGEKAVPAAQSTAGKLSASIEAGTEAIAAKSDTEQIPAGLQETLQAVENDVKTASANQILGDAGEKAVPAAKSTAAKSSASIEAGAEAIAAKSDTEQIPAGLQETLQGVENDVKAASANQILGDAGGKAVPAAQSTAGKLSASIEAGAEAIAAKSDTEPIPAELQETLQGVENDVKAASANQILGDAGEKAVPAAQSTAGKLSASIEAGAEAIAAKSDTEQIPAGLQETLQGVENDVKAASANQILGNTGAKTVPAAQSTAGKPSASIEAGAEATAAKTDTDQIPAELRETPSGVVNDGKAAPAVVREIPAGAGGNMVSEPESPLWPWRLGYSMENFSPRGDPSVLGEGSDSGLSVDESTSATRATDGLKVAESNAAFSGPDTAMLIKQIEKQLGNKDFTPESAVLQNSASIFQGGSEINLPRTENSAQNGFTYYDPYRSAELAQNAREQITGGAARGLVLEMEPDQLGKISIKVEAKKDEISVAALTQSEAARQALLRHSPELRQDLQDQGLVLDKFMVDVNREKSGEENYPEQNNPKVKTPPVSKTTRIGGIQAATGPAYIRKTNGQSRINIFA